jgi:sortase (surface protein transpeptidase)
MLAAMLTGACLAFAWATTHGSSAGSASEQGTDNVALVAAEPTVAGRIVTPLRIVIPSISVSADIEPLHRADDGTLATPANWNDAGWYADGVAPGDPGPAVIIGHLDSARAGPAVFFRLPELQNGDAVLVQDSDGTTQRFLVDSTRRVAKAQFPTEDVYGPTPLAELRLITCTGSFDHATGNYLDNLLVTAYPA